MVKWIKRLFAKKEVPNISTYDKLAKELIIDIQKDHITKFLVMTPEGFTDKVYVKTTNPRREISTRVVIPGFQQSENQECKNIEIQRIK